MRDLNPPTERGAGAVWSVGMAVCLLTAAALGQTPCTPDWLPGDGLAGADGMVMTTVAWDPDGPGPRPKLLVAGGEFKTIGDVTSPGLAAWDGEHWSSLGGATLGTYDLLALTVYNGELIAAGRFAAIAGTSASRIARWDGTQWRPLGDGLGGSLVAALAVYQGELYAGGAFSTAGGQPATNVARWDGSAWHALGQRAQQNIWCFTEHQGRLVMGGDDGGGGFRGQMAAWDGSQWFDFPTPTTFFPWQIFAMASYKGKLYVGGERMVERRLVALDGDQWQALGDTLVSTWTGHAPTLRHMSVHDDQLIVTGNFDLAGPLTVNYVGRWDGTAWSTWPALPGMFDPVTVTPFAQGFVFGGRFSASGPLPPRIAYWDGTGWGGVARGLNGQVASLVPDGDSLLAVGSFSSYGSRRLEGVARRINGEWQPVGDGAPVGMQWAASDGTRVAAAYSCCGHFVDLRFWDGASWRSIEPNLGYPVNGVTCFNGRFVFFGGFTSPGVVGLAEWDWEAQTWRPFAGGLGPAANVSCARAIGGRLIVAGTNLITSPGEPPRQFVAWDGASWSPLAGDLTGNISAMTIYRGDLVAVGNIGFLQGVSFNSVARWDGNAWTRLAEGIGDPVSGLTTVVAAEVFQDRLYVSGEFAKGASLNIASWDGASWQGLGAGAGPAPSGTFRQVRNVNTLAAFGGELNLGGTFTTAGGKAAGYFGRFGCPTPPCPANCTGDRDPVTGKPRLDVLDFTCFQNAYALGDKAKADVGGPPGPGGGCTADGQLTIADFVCFQNLYALGCP